MPIDEIMMGASREKIRPDSEKIGPVPRIRSRSCSACSARPPSFGVNAVREDAHGMEIGMIGGFGMFWFALASLFVWLTRSDARDRRRVDNPRAPR
jgi:hypothetical protein